MRVALLVCVLFALVASVSAGGSFTIYTDSACTPANALAGSAGSGSASASSSLPSPVPCTIATSTTTGYTATNSYSFYCYYVNTGGVTGGSASVVLYSSSTCTGLIGSATYSTSSASNCVTFTTVSGSNGSAKIMCSGAVQQFVVSAVMVAALIAAAFSSTKLC